MVALPREQLEDFVTQWLDTNREAERIGDWTALADFYAEDATYGWNIGPKEDVMCIGKAEIRDIALGLEMAGLQGWSYPYQKVLIDDKIGEVVGFWKQVATDADPLRLGGGGQRRVIDPGCHLGSGRRHPFGQGADPGPGR